MIGDPLKCFLRWLFFFYTRFWFNLFSLVLSFSLCPIPMSPPPPFLSLGPAFFPLPLSPLGGLGLRLGLLFSGRRHLVSPAAASADHASQPQGLNLLPGAGSQNVSLPAALQGAVQVTGSSWLHLPASSPSPPSLTTFCSFFFGSFVLLEATFSFSFFLF